MLFYEIKVKYDRQTGEDNPGKVTETYIIAGLTCSDVEQQMLEIIKPYIFGEYEVQSCKKVQFFETFECASSNEWWYKAKVEMIVVDDDKEIRKPVNILVQGDTIHDAIAFLTAKLKNYDCEIISIAKSPIVEIIKAKRS